MKKIKQKRILVIVLALSLITMYGFAYPAPQAGAVDSITDAKDTITDSDVSVIADHVFTFTTGTTTPSGGYINVIFPSGPQTFGNIEGFDCPAGNWASSTPNTYTARCTAGADNAAAANTITVYSLENPNDANKGTQYIEIENRDAGGALLERVTVAVVILDDVTMTARVTSTLTFTVTGTTTAANVSGVPCSNESTATSVPFGTLEVDATSTVCQTLRVKTNADDGFTVTVEQDHELLSNSNSNINSFNNSSDDTGSTTAEAWVSPYSLLDDENTYGHMGLHSDDSDLENGGAGYNDFDNTGGGGGAIWFAGLSSTNPMPVMHHTGPADEITRDKGLVNVLYQTEVGPLQEAGDYQSTLTYICTATF